MRVLVAPDVLSDGVAFDATRVGDLLVAGWMQVRPNDEVRAHPLTAGGWGFLDAVRATLGGEPRTALARNPWGARIPTTWLQVGRTAYLETAPLLGDARGVDAERLATDGSSAGVGDLLLAAVRAGTARVVVGAGQSGTHDGGLGLLHALAGEVDGAPSDLARAAAQALSGVEVIVAAATTEPLVGLNGAGAALAERPGIDAAAAQARELALAGVIAGIERAAPEPRSLLAGDSDRVRPSRRPHAGAGGGVAFALACVGARVLPGADVAAVESSLSHAIGHSDLVLTATSVLDGAALDNGVPGAVGRLALGGLVPAVAIAPRVLLSKRELAGTGVEAVYPLIDPPGPGAPPERVDLATALTRRASRVAKTWSR